ncbi:MAG TPA: hypothetical protein DCZ91_14745 [Lachnospiraceae bacterium]|nr:hypothetical protein [Lachnospiraceae bacterium]
MGETGEQGHTHVMWLWKSSSWAEDLLAVRRRIFMGLEEGPGKTADKGGGKIRISRLGGQGLQEGKARGFHGGKHAEPFLLLYPEELQPPVQLVKGDGEACAEPFHSGKVQEILRQDTEEEEQTVTGVGDDEIREDGVGMAAGADETHDAEAVPDRDAVHEVHQGTVIVGMDPAGAFRATAGTGLKFRMEVIHEGIKQGF